MLTRQDLFFLEGFINKKGKKEKKRKKRKKKEKEKGALGGSEPLI